ncbi:hypothetical protein Dehly_1276 [Dehalogenimonas lykanthroporepellens BL-DC-9]|nr:hypothetical protein Dehly_1276 [Dehalogenimonas lykanthroporepellens BL-DC-9]
MNNINDCTPANPEPAPEAATETPEKPEKPRRRGAQPGNRNAVTHGFYARALPAEHMEALSKAEEIEGLDEEITLLRYGIRRLLERDPDNIKLIFQIVNTLSNVIARRRYAVIKKDRHTLIENLKELLASVAVPAAAVKDMLER